MTMRFFFSSSRRACGPFHGDSAFWAISYAVLISLPRIYLGIHYPTDILAGALLGVGVASLSRIATLRKTVAHVVLGPLDQHPAFLYSFLFVCTFEIGEVFSSVWQFAVLGGEVAHKFPHWELFEAADLLLIVAVLPFLAYLVLWESKRRRDSQAANSLNHGLKAAIEPN